MVTGVVFPDLSHGRGEARESPGADIGTGDVDNDVADLGAVMLLGADIGVKGEKCWPLWLDSSALAGTLLGSG